MQTAIPIGSKMKLDEGTSGLDHTTRLCAADLPRFLAHSGPEDDEAVLPCAPSLRGRQLASVEALCAILSCVGGVRGAFVLHVVFWMACRATPVIMRTVFMSLCVAAQCEVFGRTAVQSFSLSVASFTIQGCIATKVGRPTSVVHDGDRPQWLGVAMENQSRVPR